jgi:hypothetical protein
MMYEKALIITTGGGCRAERGGGGRGEKGGGGSLFSCLGNHQQVGTPVPGCKGVICCAGGAVILIFEVWIGFKQRQFIHLVDI